MAFYFRTNVHSLKTHLKPVLERLRLARIFYQDLNKNAPCTKFVQDAQKGENLFVNIVEFIILRVKCLNLMYNLIRKGVRLWHKKVKQKFVT